MEIEIDMKIMEIYSTSLKFAVKVELRNFFLSIYSEQKMKLSIEDFFSKCDQIRSKLWIWSHLQKKSLMENFIFCAVL